MNILAKGNSMYPTMKDGQEYTMELLDNNNLNIGDIIVFAIDGLVICHRIVEIVHSKNNFIFFVTKGDNCTKVDPYAVTFDKVIGKIII